MPSGRTHDRITLWSLPLVALVALRVTLSAWLTAIVAIGYGFGGWMFGPDLDIHSVQYKRWGPLRWIWLPYRGHIRHRSRLSHGPVIGTVIRVLYFACWLGLVGIIAVDLLNSRGHTSLTWGDLVRHLGWGLRQHWPTWLALLVGLEAGALSHYGSDWFYSRLKGSRSKGRRKLKPPRSRKRQ